MNRLYVFVAGMMTFAALQSLVQDVVGWEAWITWELMSWRPAAKTVPAALFTLLFCWWICARDRMRR